MSRGAGDDREAVRAAHREGVCNHDVLLTPLAHLRFATLRSAAPAVPSAGFARSGAADLRHVVCIGDSCSDRRRPARFTVAPSLDRRYSDRERCLMTRLDEIRQRRDAVLAAAREHGARNVRIFGSVATGTASEASDVDFLVEMEPGRSLFDLVRLYDALEAIVGAKVDVVSERGLSPYLRDRILGEAVPL